MKKTVLLLTSVFVLMLGLVGCSSSDKGSDVNVEMRTVTDVKVKLKSRSIQNVLLILVEQVIFYLF